MVTIMSSQLVLSNCCRTEIKLSKKTLFDTFHWYQRHERCLKRHEKEFNNTNIKIHRLMHARFSLWPMFHCSTLACCDQGPGKEEELVKL